MQLGMIGLGRMGGNIVRRLMRAGHSCVVFDQSTDAVAALAGEGATRQPRPRRVRAASSSKPRAVWVMLPAGAITHGTIVELSAACSQAGDILIDGGNSHFHDDVAHAEMLRDEGHPLSRRRHLAAACGAWSAATA